MNTVPWNDSTVGKAVAITSVGSWEQPCVVGFSSQHNTGMEEPAQRRARNSQDTPKSQRLSLRMPEPRSEAAERGESLPHTHTGFVKRGSDRDMLPQNPSWTRSAVFELSSLARATTTHRDQKPLALHILGFSCLTKLSQHFPSLAGAESSLSVVGLVTARAGFHPEHRCSGIY